MSGSSSSLLLHCPQVPPILRPEGLLIWPKHTWFSPGPLSYPLAILSRGTSWEKMLLQMMMVVAALSKKRKKDWNLYEEVDEIGDIGKFWVFVPLLFRWKSTNGLHMFPEWFCTESECSYWGHIQCHCRRTRQLIKIEKAINQFPLHNFSNQEICQ